MSTAKNLIGMKFGRLTVIERAGREYGKRALWLCKCDCGSTTITATNRLVNGTCQSCGCLAKELFQENRKKPVHGMYKTRPFRIWHGMKQRCLNPNAPHYECYGGRGISVCDKWLDFNGFWEDMADGYSDDLTIDRIDNNGNYEPSNCRWATQEEQHSNTRSNIILTLDGITDTFKAHCKRYGINHSTAVNRVINHNYTYADAITTPVKQKYANKNYRECHPKGA